LRAKNAALKRVDAKDGDELDVSDAERKLIKQNEKRNELFNT